MDRILIILKTKMAPGRHVPLNWGYFSIIFKHVYWYVVSVYRTIGPLVVLH